MKMRFRAGDRGDTGISVHPRNSAGLDIFK
jgi:hypothetical protein